MNSTLVAALASSVVWACGGAPAKTAPATAAQGTDSPPELDRYLPLEDGTVFSYETASEAGAHGLLIAQISRPRPGRVDLRMGAKTERLEFMPDGVAYSEGGYLLKVPLVVGATWKSKSGTVRIESTDVPAQVPAGRFEGCLRTVEETTEPGASRSIRTVFCPHVGLVSMEVEANSDRGLERETAVLKSFGPRVDLAPTDTTTTTTTEQ